MKANVGKIDSSLRVIIGFVLVGLAILGKIGPWGWIGLLPIVTGAVGVCPLYTLLRISTCGKET